MASSRQPDPRNLLFGVAFVAVTLAAGACVEPFGGSNMQITFESGVRSPAAEGVTDPPNGQTPANTYFSFYAVTEVYQTDDNGDFVLDDDGEKIVSKSFAFNAGNFEVRPIIRLASPCFIDDERDRYPGLHATQFAAKIYEQTGIRNCGETSEGPECSGGPFDPNLPNPDGDITDVLTAESRMAVLGPLQSGVRAVVDFSNALPIENDPEYTLATECIESNPSVDPTHVPPTTCIGPQSNANRLAICRDYWTKHPDFYEGNDKVYTDPRNGKWRGAVNGINPKNSAPFLQGASFFLELALNDFDQLLINWQYKDRNGDDEPDYPDGTAEDEKSVIGFHYMEGLPIRKNRGVTHVPLSNRTFKTISGEAAIFYSLAEDNVQF